ncbi:MAG: DNA adenine methyltransferase YhdJ [Pelotomaculum sp. PtaB.Bin013]|nr:MAG: DNA adenine methyltransferase YhdJ [Pelotomaculum sp. PtaB.Bin013]
MPRLTSEIKEASKITSEEWKEWTKTVWTIANISDAVHPAVFPIEIPHRLIKMFSFWGETVLDPFSGIGTTGKAALNNGRKYIGIETNQGYHKIAMARLNEHATQNNLEYTDETISLFNQSSLQMDFIPDNSVGVVITSPPYWNKADYGQYAGNIGGYEFYDDFLDGMEALIRQCYRVLMPGRKMCIVTANVNQNTREYGLVTIPIASDLTKIAQSCGFSLINQIIWNKNGTGGKWGSANSQRPIFGSYPYPPNFLFKNVNEYIIIVQKSDPIKKNSKAPSYQSLFRNGVR